MRCELGSGGSFKAEIAARGQKKKRLQGGGKTVFTADKEEQLVSWIDSLRSKNLCVYEDLGRSTHEIYKHCPRINAAIK